MTIGAWLAVCLVGLFAFVWITAPEARTRTPAQYSGVVTYVIDGDTLKIRGREQSIRLWGVDAPEIWSKGSQGALNALYALSFEQRIICNEIDVDRYGRSVARCFLPDGREINRLMIASGTAKEYRYFSKGFYSR